MTKEALAGWHVPRMNQETLDLQRVNGIFAAHVMRTENTMGRRLIVPIHAGMLAVEAAEQAMTDFMAQMDPQTEALLSEEVHGDFWAVGRLTLPVLRADLGWREDDPRALVPEGFTMYPAYRAPAKEVDDWEQRTGHWASPETAYAFDPSAHYPQYAK